MAVTLRAPLTAVLYAGLASPDPLCLSWLRGQTAGQSCIRKKYFRQKSPSFSVTSAQDIERFYPDLMIVD
jgi:hypothetical protein